MGNPGPLLISPTSDGDPIIVSRRRVHGDATDPPFQAVVFGACRLRQGRLHSQQSRVKRGMYILGYFFMAVARVLDFVLIFYMWVVIARAVLSWVSPDPYNPIVRFIHNITEPVLYRIRSRIPVFFGGMDFSPIIVLLAVIFLRTFIVNSIVRFGSALI